MKPTPKIYVILATMLMALPGLARAETNAPASLPYRVLCQIAQLDVAAPAAITNREMVFTVSSENPAVKPAEIAMFIEARAGRIALAIASNGVMRVPVSAALLQENPPVVANQPKGSMNIKASYVAEGALPETDWKPKEGLYRYATLFVSEKLPGHAPPGTATTFAPVAVALQAKANLQSAKAQILLPGGAVALPSDAPGHFVLRFDAEVLEQNPWIRLSPEVEWEIHAQFAGEVNSPP